MKKFLFFVCSFCFLNTHAQLRSDSLHIHHYDINLSIIDFFAQRIGGFTDITAITRINHLPYANLDLAGLMVDSVLINNVKTSLYVHQDDIIRIQLPDNVIGDTFLLRIYYGGHPLTDSYWGGFYFTPDFAYNLGVGFQSVPHSFGRVWFPCIDLFTDKSLFRFHIRTSKEKMAVCSGVLTDSLYLADSTRLWTWELTDPIPVYLASVAVGDYQVYKDTFQGISRTIPIEIYTTPDFYANIPASFANLKQCIRIFEEKFGAFVWQRVGYVGVPFASGAMEHVCNIAYPMYVINGTNDNELLYAHELAHSWFGNLISCENAEEMWINEGFARYCEAIILENLYPNDDAFTNAASVYMQDLFHEVIQTCHVNDGDYYALTKVPQDVTYGNTSYDKGALIVHALRYYMGDSLFFSSLQSLFQDHAFTSISSENLMKALSSYAQLDLTDFYNAWIDQPGFLHFSIDSIFPLATPNQYSVYLRQRLHHATNYGMNNRMDISFISADGDIYTTDIVFSGANDHVNLNLPFEPVFAMLDYHEKLPDACISYNLHTSTEGKYVCGETKTTVQLTDIQDTTFFRIEHHLVAPDELKSSNPKIYRISDSHYWRVAYVPADCEGNLFFGYSYYNLDENLLQGCTKENIILLYRPDVAHDWQIIASEQKGTIAVGNLQTTSIKAGEYCLALGDDGDVSTPDYQNSYEIKLLPNPINDYTDVYFLGLPKVNIELWSAEGKCVYKQKNCTSPTRLYLDKYAKGAYFLFVKNKNEALKSFKILHY